MLRARLHKKFFYSIITMFLSFNMMNPTFVKASEKRAIIPTQISKTIKNDSQKNVM